MKIGFFGGTFDPVHIEHIKICLNAKEELGLDKIIVMPSGNPPHKVHQMTDKIHRFNMAKLAFKGYDFIEVSDYEINREGPSFTYLTLQYLKEIYKDDQIYLIIGSDNINEFYAWKNPELILDMAALVVSQRIGNKVMDSTINAFSRKFNTTPILLKNYGSNVSSTQMRAFLQFRLEDDYIPKDIYDYIVENDLYHNAKEFVEKVKGYLSVKRYAHTAYMVAEALKLGVWLKIDSKKAFLAASLHDIAKRFTDEELFEKFNYKAGFYPKKVEHAFAGRYIARHYFDITDEDILNAIAYHTTARADMSILERVIYTADCIEKTRNYPGVEMLRKIVYNNFEEGFTACLEETVKLLKKIPDYEICDLTYEAYNFYIK